MDRFKEVLKASNLKSTHQRLAILDSIDQFGHVDIDTLYDSIFQKYPTMSKATLYRNINDLISFHYFRRGQTSTAKTAVRDQKSTAYSSSMFRMWQC